MGWDKRPRATDASRRLLNSNQWRVQIRNYFIEKRLPCARCGREIDYRGNYYLPGTRRKNPRYLHIGHKVERDRAKALGWTDEEINDLSNLQQECGDCSNRSGARYAKQKQVLTSVRHVQLSFDNSREW